MWSWIWVDRVGRVLREVGLPTTIFIAVVSFLLVMTRQPVRRMSLARAGVLLLPILAILTGFSLVPRYHVVASAMSCGASVRTCTGIREYYRLPARITDAGREVGNLAMDRSRPDASLPARSVCRSVQTGAGICWGELAQSSRSTHPSEAAMAVYESIPSTPGQRRPKLRVVDRIGRPVLVGFLDPIILIPPTVDHPESLEPLRLSLLHELAHAESSDLFFGVFANLAQVFWFMLPPVWWVAARMRIDQEFLADRRAANDFGPLSDYASTLLAFARPGVVLPGARGLRADQVVPGGSVLFQRVLMLVRCPFPVERKPPTWWRLGLICLAIPFTIGLASLTFTSGREVYSAQTIRTLNAFPMASLTLPPLAPGLHGRYATLRTTNPPTRRIRPVRRGLGRSVHVDRNARGRAPAGNTRFPIDRRRRSSLLAPCQSQARSDGSFALDQRPGEIERPRVSSSNNMAFRGIRTQSRGTIPEAASILVIGSQVPLRLCRLSASYVSYALDV